MLEPRVRDQVHWDAQDGLEFVRDPLISRVGRSWLILTFGDSPAKSLRNFEAPNGVPSGGRSHDPCSEVDQRLCASDQGLSLRERDECGAVLDFAFARDQLAKRLLG